MQIIVDEIDGIFYCDIVMSPNEIVRVKRSETIEGQAIHRKRKCYVGVRMAGQWDEEEEDEDEQQ